MRFEGRVALITAAASGIGRATAEIISAEGGTVVAVDTDEGRLKDMVSAIQSAGGRATPIKPMRSMPRRRTPWWSAR